MAAKTTWGPAPWLPKQTWLLKDNSVLQSPDLETTTSGQRVRVVGTTSSFAKSKIDEMLVEAARNIAQTRLTDLWVRLIDDDEARRAKHGGVSPGPGRKPEYQKAEQLFCMDPDNNGHTQITFEFVSEDCPSLTATVWVIVNKYSHHRNQYQVLSGITYQTLHERSWNMEFTCWGGDPENWWTPFSYYASGPEVDASKEFLSGFNPIPDMTWHNSTHSEGARQAVTDALSMVKQIRDVEYIDIPVWRTSETVTTMRYKFKRTNFTSALYNDMVEFIQVKPTFDRIRQNYEQIKRDMAALGIVMTNTSSDNFLQIVEEGFAENVVCHMIPMTEEGNPEVDHNGTPQIVEDHAHTVSVDLLSGTIVVNCAQGDTEVLEHWNFERTKAELHGELDSFLGFAAKKQQRRTRKKFQRIVKERTPEEFSPESLDA